MTLHAGTRERRAGLGRVRADFIIVNMVAEAATGQVSSQAAAARAESRARRYYKT